MDYRALLKKYIRAVSEGEGDDFALNPGFFGEFSPAEREELKRLLDEADAEHARAVES